MVKVTQKEKPPIYEECVKIFDVSWNKGTIFTYGDTIYCKYKLNNQKLAHEKTHVKQQLQYGISEWWARYFTDKEFRLNQEVEAYINEVNYIKFNERNLIKKRELLDKITNDLASSMYGNLVTFEEAKLLIGA